MTSSLKRLLGSLVGVVAAAGFALVLALPTAAGAQTASRPYTNEQLDQLLAQIALYPDSLLSQVLMAATYPEDFAAAAAWSKAHPDAKGDEAVRMVANEPWDPAVASLVAFPEVAITLGDQPDYVRKLGDAFLAQPNDVMDSVQRLRAAAQKAGNLSSNEQIKVSTQTVQPPAPAPAATTTVVVQQAPAQQVIVIEPAQPSVVFVPAYNPAVVYGPWWYPAFPPFYYPPPPGYWFSRTIATGIAFGVGIGISNALWGGCNWGRGNVNINVNRYNNINVNRRMDVNRNNVNWNHNPDRRKAPYPGGDATRQKLDRDYKSASREQYRGRDGARDASRDASRERAAQSMQARGVDVKAGSALERAQSIDRDAARQKAQNVDRDAARQKAQNVDRDAARQKAQNVDRDAARQKAQNVDRDAARSRAAAANRDNALKGANSPQPRAQADRGASSRAAAQQRASAGSRASAQPRAQAPRPSAGGARGGGQRGGGRGR
jgi:hypothetical protein